ncbi:hypothetical protein C0991_009351 [Blastosporella zonata]|nr:hypothetical protein C0991_009351 [Blastosporella zonata]
MTGIIFCMIVARAHRSVNNTSQQQISISNSSTRHIGHALRPLAIKVTTQVVDDIDSKTADIGTPPISPGGYTLQSVSTTHEMRHGEV